MAIHKPLQNRRVQRCFNSDLISTASGPPISPHPAPPLRTISPTPHHPPSTKTAHTPPPAPPPYPGRARAPPPGHSGAGAKNPYSPRYSRVYRPAPDSFKQRSRTIRPAAGWRECLHDGARASRVQSRARGIIYSTCLWAEKRRGASTPPGSRFFRPLFGHRTALGLTLSLGQRYPTFPFARVFAFAAVRFGCGITLRFAFACVNAAAFDLSFFGGVDVLRK